MKRFALLALLLMGCGGTPGPANPSDSATPVADSTAAAGSGNNGWFTQFGPDGSFSVQFPKAPETVGKSVAGMTLAYPLDKMASSLTLVQAPLPLKFTAQDLAAIPNKNFGKNTKIVKNEKFQLQGRDALRLEMEISGNRVFMVIISAKPWLFQLVAFQSSASQRDYAVEREQFFQSFQFTR